MLGVCRAWPTDTSLKCNDYSGKQGQTYRGHNYNPGACAVPLFYTWICRRKNGGGSILPCATLPIHFPFKLPLGTLCASLPPPPTALLASPLPSPADSCKDVSGWGAGKVPIHLSFTGPFLFLNEQCQ